MRRSRGFSNCHEKGVTHKQIRRCARDDKDKCAQDDNRSRGLAAIVFGLLLAVACATVQTVVRIAPSARADSLVFLLRSAADSGRPANWVYGLSVVRCNTETSVWTIASDGGQQIPPSIVYGQPVPGFSTRAGPATLTPGCYDVFATGAARRRFDVLADRTIVVRLGPDTARKRP